MKQVLESWKNILYIGLPAATNNVVGSLSAAIITRLIATYGASAVAAFGVAHRIESFVLMTFASIALVISPFVGQNIGAGKFA